MHSEFMSFMADALAEAGLRTCRFNFPYLEAGRKSPDRAPVLEETYRRVVDAVERRWSGPIYLGGKSMGGRIASQVVAGGVEAAGLVFLGYPLHPPGKPERIRDEHLYQVKPPMLFVEGTRDPFCPLAALEGVRSKLPGRADVVVIEDGDHSFKVRKASGRSTAEAWGEVVSVVRDWIAQDKS